jgi:hypothetical protein
MTRILAIDLGKFKSVACLYDAQSAAAEFQTLPTTPQAVHDLLVAFEPDRLVIEVCGIAGWIHDMATDLEISIESSNGWIDLPPVTSVSDGCRVFRASAIDRPSWSSPRSITPIGSARGARSARTPAWSLVSSNQAR